jgi:hypothetical protein
MRPNFNGGCSLQVAEQATIEQAEQATIEQAEQASIYETQFQRGNRFRMPFGLYDIAPLAAIELVYLRFACGVEQERVTRRQEDLTT